MQYKSIQNSYQDQMHSFFSNNIEDFRGLCKYQIKQIMINMAIKELQIPAENVYEYVEDMPVDFFLKPLYN